MNFRYATRYKMDRTGSELNSIHRGIAIILLAILFACAPAAPSIESLPTLMVLPTLPPTRVTEISIVPTLPATWTLTPLPSPTITDTPEAEHTSEPQVASVINCSIDSWLNDVSNVFGEAPPTSSNDVEAWKNALENLPYPECATVARTEILDYLEQFKLVMLLPYSSDRKSTFQIYLTGATQHFNNFMDEIGRIKGIKVEHIDQDSIIATAQVSSNTNPSSASNTDTSSGSGTSFTCPSNCTQARAMGLSASQAAACGLDRDGDGVACYGD